MKYKYSAADSQKRTSSGALTASSKEEAAEMLGKRGLTPITIKEIPDKSSLKKSLPLIEKIIFCRYLSTMLNSGLSLSEGVEVLYEESQNPLMREILSDLKFNLERGQQLSVVFEKYPQVFDPYFLTLTRAGELSGTLSLVFKNLETEMRSEYSLTSKVKGALMYPSIVFTAMIGIGFLMFFFVLPQIGKVFLNLNLPLPAVTKALFTASVALSKQVVPIVIGSVLAVLTAFFAIKRKSTQKAIWHVITIIPMVRNLIRKIDMARFNRLLSTLLKSAVPITQAVEISLDSLASPEYKDLGQVFSEEIRKGKSLASIVKQNKAFPTFVSQMVATGEKSGTLDSSLSEVAQFYEQEVEEDLKNLTQIIEPLLMLIVGIAVGAMILSIIAPIYSVVGSFQTLSSPPR